MEEAEIKISKTIMAALVTMGITVLGSAAKAYVDVETLKTRVDIYVEDQREIKEDIREIKNDIKDLLVNKAKE